MATPKDFYVPIDMHGLEILNHRLHILASDPGSPNDGEIWFNSTADEPRVRATRGSTGANRALIADDDDFQGRLNTVTSIQDADMVMIWDDSATAIDHQSKYRQITKANFVSGLSTVLDAYNSITVDSGGVNPLVASGPSSLVLAGDGSILTFVGSAPVTNTATLTWSTQTANLVFAGPSSGGAAAPTFRALVDLDMPATYDPTNWDTAYSHSGITGTNPHGVDMDDLGYGVVTTLGDPGTNANLVTEAAIRSAIGSAISGGVTYKGGYNATTDTPNLDDRGTPIAGILTGDMYIVTTAGTFFTETVDVGDMMIAIQDTPTLLAHWTLIAREWDETFLELGDTPSAYTASGGFMVMVNSTPDALEFIDPSGYALSNFNDDLSYVSWGSETGLQPIVFGANAGDIDSENTLAYNPGNFTLTLDSLSAADSILQVVYNSTFSIGLRANSFSGILSATGILYLTPSGVGSRIGVGSGADPDVFFYIKDSNATPLTSLLRLTDDATTATLFDVRQNGTVYVPGLGADEAETYVVAIDNSSGLLTKRSVSSIAGTAGDVSWGTETGEQPITYGATAGDIDSSSLFTWNTSTSTLALKVGALSYTSLSPGSIGLFHIAEGAYAAMQFNTYSNTALYASSTSHYRFGGTVAAPAAAPTDAKTLQDFYFVNDGTASRVGGYFAHMVDGAIATDDFDTKFEWALKEGAAVYALMVTLGVNGFEYAADHSADQDANDRWIPDWGAVKTYADGAGDVSWGTETGDQPVVFGATAGDIDSSTQLIFNSTTHILTLDSEAAGASSFIGQYNGNSRIHVEALNSAGQIRGDSVLFLDSIGVGHRLTLGNTVANGVFLTVYDSNTSDLTSLVQFLQHSTANVLADFREDGTIYFPELANDDTEAHVIAIDDGTGLLSKRSVSSFSTGSATFIGLTDVPANFTGAENNLVLVNGTPDALIFSSVADLTTITDIADTDLFLVELAAGGLRDVSWASLKTEMWEDHSIDNHSEVTITSAADNHLLVYDTSGTTLVNKKAKHSEVIVGDDVETDFDVVHGLGTEDVIVQVWAETGDDMVTPSITKTSGSTTTTVTIGFSTAPATGTNYKVIVYGFEG